MIDKTEKIGLYFKELWFTRSGGLLLYLFGAILGSVFGFLPFFTGWVLGIIISLVIDRKVINYFYDGVYCPHCESCGEIYCCGIRQFLEKHVRGKTNCFYEDRVIDQIIEHWEDCKEEV